MGMLDDLCVQQVTNATRELCDKKLFPYQLDGLCRLLNMCHPSSGVHPDVCLCVQGTSGGKSMARETFGYIASGVTLTIIPHLGLGADRNC